MWFVFPLAVFTTDEGFRKAAGTQRRDRERRCIRYPLRNFVQPAGAGFFDAIDMQTLTLPLHSHIARICARATPFVVSKNLAIAAA